MISAILQIVLAYFLVDLGTGLYHYVTDRGWNFRQQVELFQRHHVTNSMDGFDWQPMLAGVPIMVAGLWLLSPFVLALGSFAILGQVPHYYAHRRSDSPVIQRIVRSLQRGGLIMSPRHHAAHHNGTFDRNFCILSGWNNWWLNRLIK